MYVPNLEEENQASSKSVRTYYMGKETTIQLVEEVLKK